MNEKILKTKIDKRKLSIRSWRVLYNLCIDTFGDLVKQKPSDLLKEQNFGLKSLREVEKMLYEHGLYLETRSKINGMYTKKKGDPK